MHSGGGGMECCPPVVDYLTYISLLAFIGGFQLEFICISWVISYTTCYNLVEITAFRLESKSCKGFFLTKKISTNDF